MGRRFYWLIVLVLLAGICAWSAYRAGLRGHLAGKVSATASHPVAASSSPAATQSSSTGTVLATSNSSSPVGYYIQEPTFVAIRFDKTRVLFRVVDEHSDFELSESQMQKLTNLGEPVAKSGGGTVFEPNDEILQAHPTLFKQAHAGEKWALDVSAGKQVPVVIQKPVVLNIGCFASAAFLAEVPTTDQADFSASPLQYFLVREISSISNPTATAKPSRVGPLPEWKATPELHAAIEQLLKDREKNAIAKVHAEAEPEYQKLAGATADWKAWADNWERMDPAAR